jgi:hypothetical protein
MISNLPVGSEITNLSGKSRAIQGFPPMPTTSLASRICSGPFQNFSLRIVIDTALENARFSEGRSAAIKTTCEVSAL